MYMTTNRAVGRVKGEPRLYLIGHSGKRLTPLVEDRGYESPCWVWPGSLSRQGYATSKRDGRNIRIHRWNYEQKYGPIPAGFHLDHLCRVRACVNPDHMEPVTHAENLRRGAGTTLKAEEVAVIKRRLLDGGETHPTIAKDYGVVAEAVSLIACGINWKDIEPAPASTKEAA